ncbi:lantibiotic dehydratase [Actinocorallia libanotica]|uniref:Lantibiotic dehydratase n=1 Tax=Actinocorallia libanotica TaxID=46162 RepID=A0ABP4BWH5_9ACTN
MRATRPVLAALEAARAPSRVGDLADTLAGAFPHAAPGQIATVLAELIGQNLLISSLNPPASSPDALGHVCAVLRRIAADDIPEAAELVQTLGALHEGISAAQPLLAEHGDDQAGETTEGLVSLRAEVVLDAHVDLPEQVAHEAARAAGALCRLSPYPFGTAAWRDYHARFVARYGTDQPVGVLELTGDSGLGFPAGYLGSGAGRAPRPFTRRDEKLLLLVQEAIADGGELLLTDALIADLADDQDAVLTWPDRVEIGVQVNAASLQDIDRGAFTLLVTGSPRTGSSMIGRHTQHLPQPARKALADTFNTTDPAAVAVQLSFPPLHRRNYPLAASIPLVDRILPLAEQPADPAIEHAARGVETMTVADLAVVAELDRFHLIHQPSGKRIEVRVPHALEATAHIGALARLLSEISTARGTLYAGFYFGAADRLPYLPRVRYRRTILAAARWLLPATALPAPTATTQVWDEALTQWRQRWSVPTCITVVEIDRKLPLDLEQPLHRHLLRTRLNQTSRLEIRETLSDHTWIGRAHELLLPLRLTTSSPASPALAASRPLEAVARSSWVSRLPAAATTVSAQLHTHPARWDELLTGYLPHLLESIPDLQGWWFRRHHDLRHPDRMPYLALYLQASSSDGYPVATGHLAAWTNELINQNLAAALVLDTYWPQPGRYGHGPALEAAHRLFTADSAAALAQIDLSLHTGIPTAAVTAASMLDLAAALAGNIDDGTLRLIADLPQQHGPLDPGLRDYALHLTHPTTDLTALPGGSQMISAWRRRATALADYREALAAGRDPIAALPVLLRDHQRRTLGASGEQTVLRLVRACALRHTRQTAR